MSLAERARRARAIEAAAGGVEACRKCGIGSTRTRSVYGEGDPCAALMVVGEGPGETEDKLGRPFVGRAGELLDKMLAAIDLVREDVFICNTVKCRPTLDDGNRLRNRAPDPQEMKNCRPYLDLQIEIIRPRVILALGAPGGEIVHGREVLDYEAARAAGSRDPGGSRRSPRSTRPTSCARPAVNSPR
jgi:uracil-DNA glycosylase family 4